MKIISPQSARLLAINVTILLLLTFICGAILNYRRHGRIYLQIDDDGFIRDSAMRGISEHRPPKWIGDNSPLRYEENCFSLHPYFGFSDACVGKRRMGFTKEFYLDENMNQGRDGVYRVLILGGSVASHISTRTSLEVELNRAIRGSKRLSSLYSKSSVFNAALGGYKQPQQSLILSTLLSEGFRFDAIVNINGFNELALPIAENYDQRISLALPRSHVERETKEHEYLSGQTSTLTSTKMIMVTDAILSWHPLYIYIRNGALSPLVARERDELMGKIRSSQPYKYNIPSDESQAFFQSMKIWVNSSKNAFLLAQGYNVPYYEYFQPNQYLAGSKQLTPNERKHAYSEHHMYGTVIRKYYSGVSADEFGIPREHIWDGRNLYKDISADVYVDDCCHMNGHGMALMAKDIARRLLSSSPNITAAGATPARI